MEPEKQGIAERGMFIGEKPLMSYVTVVVLQFTTRNAKSVKIKARGKFITKAVDVAEVAVKRFLESQAGIKEIKTDSENFRNSEGKEIRVSSIEITIART